MTKGNGWGGARPGAGRQKTSTKQTVTLYLPGELITEAKQRAAERGETTSAYVAGAIEDKNRRCTPDLRALKSAAWFDAYIDAARDERDLNDIENDMKYTYTGTDADRGRLLERIRAEKMRMRKRGNDNR